MTLGAVAVCQEHAQRMASVHRHVVTVAERGAWHACHRLNNGEFLEPAAEKWSMGINLCAATPGPNRDRRDGGPH
jgi:hypothetical protein